MEKIRLYKVSFDKQRNHRICHMAFYTMAKNATEAKNNAKTAWSKRFPHCNKVPYMFHLEAHRFEDIEELKALEVRIGLKVDSTFHEENWRRW